MLDVSALKAVVPARLTLGIAGSNDTCKRQRLFLELWAVRKDSSPSPPWTSRAEKVLL